MEKGGKEIIKKYSNSDITVTWKPNTCIHATHCWKQLIQVFNPKNRPWINMEGATTDRIKKQIEACPSGALSYNSISEENTTESELETKVETLKDGPLLVHGSLQVSHTGGLVENKSKVTAFCRCGASNNKPYCDGAHKESGFKG